MARAGCSSRAYEKGAEAYAFCAFSPLETRLLGAGTPGESYFLSRRFFSAFLWWLIRRRFLFTWRSVRVFFLPS